MGTRNLVMVKIGRSLKVAQYGQWDGYPTGQGVTIAKFLQTMDREKFVSELNKLQWIKKTEIKNRWNECGADPKSDMVSMSVSARFRARYPALSRDIGAGVLQLIQDGKVDKLDDSRSFLKDRLFCEFAYVLNMNTNCVEFYNGGEKPSQIIKFKDFTVELMKTLE